MNTHTYEIIDAALRHPHIITDVWGPGWAGYDRSVPLSENVRRRAWRVAHLEESQRAHERKKAEWWDYKMGNVKRKLRGERGAKADKEKKAEVSDPGDWQRPEWGKALRKRQVAEADGGQSEQTVEMGAKVMSLDEAEEAEQEKAAEKGKFATVNQEELVEEVEKTVCHPSLSYDIVWTIS